MITTIRTLETINGSGSEATVYYPLPPTFDYNERGMVKVALDESGVLLAYTLRSDRAYLIHYANRVPALFRFSQREDQRWQFALVVMKEYVPALRITVATRSTTCLV